jgi:putative spermidine/putrescine transport system permease protein
VTAREHRVDRTALLVVPGLLVVLLLFIYPFLYGLFLSFEPKQGNWLANYLRFFSEPFLFNTIETTLSLAVPTTLVNVGLALPIAFRIRRNGAWQRVLTTILVLPITLGTVLIAEGLLTYLGPQGWVNRLLIDSGLASTPIRLTHNYWGVFLALIIAEFPFALLLILSYINRDRPGAPTGCGNAGRRPWTAVPARIPAAPRARARDHLLPLLRSGLLRLPDRGTTGRPGGSDPSHFHRCLHCRLRGVRLLDGLGDRDDHGSGAADHSRRRARLARRLLSRSRRRGKSVSAVAPSVPRRSFGDRLWSTAMAVLITFFVINVFGIIASVIVSSFATRWLGTWLPSGWTTRWYRAAWAEFQLDEVLFVTMKIVFIVVALSILIGVPAAYALARRDFAGKKVVQLLFLLPLLVPAITYGIPLATVLYQAQLAGTMNGVVLANLVPTVPFVILVMTPFIEQIDPRLEAAARVFGAGPFRVFRHVLVPLLAPGILAASLLVLVRTIAMFELTFLTAGPDSQTLVVVLYYSVFAAGVRATQSIDAMAVTYMVTTLVWLLIALRFVNPTQLVTRVKEQKI